MSIHFSLNQGAVRTPARFAWAAVAMAASAVASSTVAANEARLSPTVVTATRSETKLDETLADVRVITQEQISHFAGRSLAEVLQRLAGVQMSSNGGRGNTQSIRIRGSSQVILLIDGTRFGSATAGDPSLQSLPIEQIERIEVVQGPASALYGSDAIGGVIQIFTKQGKGARKAFEPRGDLTWGSAGYKDASAGFVGAQHGWNYSVNVSRVLDPGFSATNEKIGASYSPDKDKLSQSAISASLGYAFNDAWRLDANLLQAKSYAEFDNAEYQYPNTYLLQDAWLNAQAGTRSFKLTGVVSPIWKTHMSVARSLDKQSNHYQTVVTGAHSSDQFSTTQSEFQWGNEVQTGVGIVVAGMDRLVQKIDTSTPFETTKRTTNAVYAGLNGSHAAHAWQINVRRDDNSQYGNYHTWGLSYGYTLLPGLQAHFSRASSLKAPTFNDLYYPSLGNPLLQPERGHSNEIGLAWSTGIHSLKLLGFDNKVQNLIAWAPDTSGSWKPANVNQARLKGWSLLYSVSSMRWDLNANYEHLNARDGTGQPIDNRAKHQATVTLNTHWGAWKLGASALYVSQRQHAAAAFLPSYTTIDAYAQYPIAKGWAVQARVANLTDKQYETVYGYNQRGLAAYLTLKWAPK